MSETKAKIQKAKRHTKNIRKIHEENINSNHECIAKSYLILKHAQESAHALLQAFQIVREKRKARGASTDEEQDLLRAMLVYAGAGLDAMVKQLFRDAIPVLFNLDTKVATELEKFLVRQLRGETETPISTGGTTFLARILLSTSRQEHLLDEYVKSLTGGSLQSVDELHKACKALGIESRVLKTSKSNLRTIFYIRNQIIHELDIDFGAPRRNRHSRQQSKMVNYSNILLATGESILAKVSKKFEELEK